jgi:hypothetical protein
LTAQSPPHDHSAMSPLIRSGSTNTASKASWVNLQSTQRDLLEAWARGGSGYRVLSPVDIVGLLPAGLHPKIQSVVLMVAPTSTGGVYVIANNHRVDRRAWAIDQEPFGSIIDSTGARAQAVVIHHGSWPGRTIRPPTAFWDHLDRSGIGTFFPLSTLPEGSSGPLEDLQELSHLAAFENFKMRFRSSY